MGEFSIDHGILFKAEMVRAILAGTKTQTRRLVTPHVTWFDGDPWPKWHKEATWDWGGAWVDGGPSPAGNAGPYLHLPFVSHTEPGLSSWWEKTSHRIYPRVQPGDRLWIKETWRQRVGQIEYRATTHPVAHNIAPWRPSIFMPRSSARITLRVTRVRIERLQDISAAEAWAEGVRCECTSPVPECAGNVAVFRALWDSIHAKRAPWAHNPWVLVYEWWPYHD